MRVLGTAAALCVLACGNAEDDAPSRAGSGGQLGGAPSAGAGGERAGSGGVGGGIEIHEPKPSQPPATDSFPPRRGSWDPGFPVDGMSWRESSVPFCSPWVAQLDVDLWAGDLGVAAMVTADCNPLADRPCSVPGATLHQSLLLNSGSGWTQLYHYKDSPLRFVAGTRSGELLASGSCAAARVGGAAEYECLWPEPVLAIASATSRGSTHVLARADATPRAPAVLLSFRANSSAQTPLPSITTPIGLAAIGDDLLILSDDGTLTRVAPETGVMETTHAPKKRYVGIHEDPVNGYVLSTDMGKLVQPTASGWRTLDTALDSPLDIWVTPTGLIYVLGSKQLVVVENDELRTVLTAGDCCGFGRIAGLSTTEVFLTAYDSRLYAHQCGTAYLLWFDGRDAHLL